jgi:hypothetical protein
MLLGEAWQLKTLLDSTPHTVLCIWTVEVGFITLRYHVWMSIQGRWRCVSLTNHVLVLNSTLIHCRKLQIRSERICCRDKKGRIKIKYMLYPMNYPHIVVSLRKKKEERKIFFFLKTKKSWSLWTEYNTWPLQTVEIVVFLQDSSRWVRRDTTKGRRWHSRDSSPQYVVTTGWIPSGIRIDHDVRPQKNRIVCLVWEIHNSIFCVTVTITVSLQDWRLLFDDGRRSYRRNIIVIRGSCLLEVVQECDTDLMV